jgi:hypothetical protein
VLLAWGVAVAVTGGIDTRVAGVAIRSRDPFRALAAGVALLLVASVVYRTECTAMLDRAGASLRRHAVALALVAAAALAAHGVVFGSFGVGGSDPYGYVNQAYDWVSGALPRPIPLTLSLPFETSDAMQVPLGYRVGPQPHTMVPTYAPGLPLLMAVALLAGKCGPFLVVPFFAALFVWFTFRLGQRAGGSAVGVVAAAVLLTSPVVLYQTLWPMSDIPAGAVWTAALVFALGPSHRSAAAAGGFAALGMLVRPNLALVAAVPVLTMLVRSRGRDRWRKAALYAAPIVPVVLLVGAINTMWFGSSTSTGYGSTDELYHASNIWPNVRLNASWLWESQSAWVVLALVPLLPAFGRAVNRRVLAVCVILGLATFASYASYAQFESWWYLRFLMPALGGLAVLVASGIVALARTIPQPFGRIAAAVALCTTIATTLSFASSRQIFGGIQAGERRYLDVAEFAADHLPSDAALFAVQHSGSLRFYSGRLMLRFDLVQKEWAPGVPAAVERTGYHPYLVVDDWEIPQVRRQFGLPPDARLPWPIVARMRELGGVTIFDMATAPQPHAPIALEPVRRHACDARPRAAAMSAGRPPIVAAAGGPTSPAAAAACPSTRACRTRRG